MKSLEEYISAIQEISETEEKALLLKADLLAEAKQYYDGKGFAKTMAEALGCSARHVQELVKVAKTFSQEERLYHLPFSIYLTCARTKEPKRWLIYANDNQLSVRQLREAIRAEKDTGDLDERCRKAGERLYRSIIEFKEKYKGSKALWEQIQRLTLALNGGDTDGIL